MDDEIAEYEAEMDRDLVSLNRQNAEALVNDMKPPSEFEQHNFEPEDQ